MGFPYGPVSFRRFYVVGKHPKSFDQRILDKLAEFALQVGEYGVPDPVEYGWCGGRHVLDSAFTFEHNVFADALHFALRLDTNRVPAELKRAYQAIEEEAAAASNPSGILSKQQKRQATDSVRRKLDEDLKSGKFRRSKLIPVLWDLPSQSIFCPVGPSAMPHLFELFERTFELTLEPLTAGSAALRWAEHSGKRRDYEDARPTRFVPGPEGESQQPHYPWLPTAGPQPKNFLGDEFLLWLWHYLDTNEPAIETSAGEISILLDHTLDLDCAFGQSGHDTLRGDGPTRMPEARDALRSGKLPRRAGMILETGGHQFDLTLNPETLGCSGAKFPDIEDAEDARTLFEERIALLRDLAKAIDALFETFLKLRAGSPWEGQTAAIRRWILSSQKQAAVA